MKKLVLLTLFGSVVLAACGATLNRSGVKLTCPSCGYQFDMPASRP